MIQHLASFSMLSRRRIQEFVVHNVLHADDPPHRLALGAALGVFVTFTPTIGLQMVLVVFLAWLFGANKVIGVPVVWLSNPATVVPIYYSSYAVGRRLLSVPPIGADWWRELAHPPAGGWSAITFYWSRLVDIAGPLWVGCLVMGFLAAYPTYYFTLFLIRRYRLRRWGQIIPPEGAHRPPPRDSSQRADATRNAKSDPASGNHHDPAA